jgi:hypothetical protein
MDYIYIVVEEDRERRSCGAYPQAYENYNLAVNAVTTKYQQDIEEQDIKIPLEIKRETYIYIEKGIDITITKLPIIYTTGGKKPLRKTRISKKNKTRKNKKNYL